MIHTFEHDDYWVSFDTEHQVAVKGEGRDRSILSLHSLIKNQPPHKWRSFPNKYEVTTQNDCGAVLKIPRDTEDFIFETASLLMDVTEDCYVVGFPILRKIRNTALYEIIRSENLSLLPGHLKEKCIYSLEYDLAVLKGTPLPNPPGFPEGRSYDEEFKKYGTVVIEKGMTAEEGYKKHMLDRIVE